MQQSWILQKLVRLYNIIQILALIPITIDCNKRPLMRYSAIIEFLIDVNPYSLRCPYLAELTEQVKTEELPLLLKTWDEKRIQYLKRNIRLSNV